MMNTSKIYQDLKDVHVSNVIVYTNGTDGKAYVDSSLSKQFASEDLKDAYEKGCLVKDSSGNYYTPVGYAVATGAASINYVVNDSNTLKLKTLAAVAFRS